jgi:hypothetical protein
MWISNSRNILSIFSSAEPANRAEPEQRQDATVDKILFLYYEESLVHIIKFEFKTI